MYYKDRKVKVPNTKTYISKKTSGKYANYEYDRVYNKEKQYNIPKRTTIGLLCEEDETYMYPNENYYKFFDVEDVEEVIEDTPYEPTRSSCLKVGTFIVLKKLLEESKIDHILMSIFKEYGGLFADFMFYSIITEGNVAQYYESYSFDHPLMTLNMKQYSDSTLSKFFKEINKDHRIDFFNQWNDLKDKNDHVYISYDSTNKNCSAGDIDLVEFGNAKVDVGKNIFNYSIGYDCMNNDPLFYEAYPGSIVDVSELRVMIDKAKSFGYENVGMILDRGYFSKENINYMDENNVPFVIMMKGKKALVRKLVLENKNAFENEYDSQISRYNVSGITLKGPLYPHDELTQKERYFHLYYSNKKNSAEVAELRQRLQKMEDMMNSKIGTDTKFSSSYSDLYELYYSEKDGKFNTWIPKKDKIKEELSLCGYFVIITSTEMSFKQALWTYKGRDVSEKLFRGDKSYLGNSSMRVHSNEAFEAKIFIEFVALILRNRYFQKLKSYEVEHNVNENYFDVPASIRELEKIEIVKYNNQDYKLEYALTKKQKTILKAFDINHTDIKNEVKQLAAILKKY